MDIQMKYNLVLSFQNLNVKGALCSFGEGTLIRRQRSSMTDLLTYFFLYIAHPATFLASDSVEGTSFPIRTVCFFSHEKHF